MCGQVVFIAFYVRRDSGDYYLEAYWVMEGLDGWGEGIAGLQTNMRSSSWHCSSGVGKGGVSEGKISGA